MSTPDAAFLQLLEDIYDGDLLVANLRHEKGLGKNEELQGLIREVEADLSYMRARKSYFLNVMLAEVTGTVLPAYDAAAVTHPLGERIREIQATRMYDMREAVVLP